MLTDHEDKVLHNLQGCVTANSHAASDGSTTALPAASAASTTSDITPEIHDPGDADSCDDMDDFFAVAPAQESVSQMPRDTTRWDNVSRVCCCVTRFLVVCTLIPKLTWIVHVLFVRAPSCQI